jgi:hypothetical protein
LFEILDEETANDVFMKSIAVKKIIKPDNIRGTGRKGLFGASKCVSNKEIK